MPCRGAVRLIPAQTLGRRCRESVWPRLCAWGGSSLGSILLQEKLGRSPSADLRGCPGGMANGLTMRRAVCSPPCLRETVKELWLAG